MKNHFCLSYVFILFLSCFINESSGQTDTTTYFNQYDLTDNSVKSYIVGVNDGLYTVDTQMYLGESNTNNFRPIIDTQWGLEFYGNQIGIIYGSGSSTTDYSNEIRNSGSSVLLWAYILDAYSLQMLFCKQNILSNKNSVDKLCIGVHEGYFIGKVYNETLKFDREVYLGWNLVVATFELDETDVYTRIKLVTASKASIVASTKTFSYKFQDDIDYDLLIGGHYSSDGETIKDGFAGYILEFRLYSSDLLTLTEIDYQIDWDCTLYTTKFCEFCPRYVYTANQCLEDLVNVADQHLMASYVFDDDVAGYNRYYYANEVNANTFRLYFGTPWPDRRLIDSEPHRSEVNGLYFDGDDFMTMYYLNRDSLAFNKEFTIEMWIRIEQETISQNYVLFQKLDGTRQTEVKFQSYFQPDYSFAIDLNTTQYLVIPNAYNSTSYLSKWVFVGVSLATLQYNTLDEIYRVQMCAYLYGPDDQESYGCAIADEAWEEKWYYPFYYTTRIGDGYIGFIRTVYMYEFAKTIIPFYYTPLRNYPLKDECTPWTDQQAPACDGCDQLLGASECYSSCHTNSYADTFSYCFERNCTNTLCTVCYAEGIFTSQSVCTACIEHAYKDNELDFNCQCELGYYQDDQDYQEEPTCEPCHEYCTQCDGPDNTQCFECAQGRPYWGYQTCIESCVQLGDTYVYDEESNTCVSCYEYYYTTDWLTCEPLPYPLKGTNYNNDYVIIDFSQPVTYNTFQLPDLVQVSIDGPKAPYNMSWAIPYWSKNQFQQNVFMSMIINNTMTGDEVLFIYINTQYFTDQEGYNMMVRNSTSEEEYLPLRIPLNKKTYIDPDEAARVANAGNSVLISMLITVGFNAGINLLSSGSLETMWAFINVMQITAYIPLLQLTFPYNIVTLFTYLSVVNSDIVIFGDWFQICFNLNKDSFVNDTTFSENFETQGMDSMKFFLNARSILAILCLLIVFFPIVVSLKLMCKKCFACGSFWHGVEEGSKWNGVIRLYMESFLEIHIAVFINILAIDFSTPLEKFNSIMCLFLITLTAAVPLGSSFFLFLNRENFESPFMKSKFGAFYEMFKHDHWYNYMHHLVFYVRRVAFMCLLIFLKDNEFMQLILFQTLNFLMISIVAVTRPYKDTLVNIFAIMNETFLFIIGCYLFIFLDSEADDEVLKFYGWVIIGLVICQVVVNLGIIIPLKIIDAYREYQENKRMKNLRYVNQVERKYLNFNYKRFFLRGLHFENFRDDYSEMSPSDTETEVRSPPANDVPDYQPSVKSSDPSEDDNDNDDDQGPQEKPVEEEKETIAPQAHTLIEEKPIQKPPTPQNNPMDTVSNDPSVSIAEESNKDESEEIKDDEDIRPETFQSEEESKQESKEEEEHPQTDHNDEIDPLPLNFEKRPSKQSLFKSRSYANIPDFKWMDDQNKEPSSQQRGGSPKSRSNKMLDSVSNSDKLFHDMSPREEKKQEIPEIKDLYDDYQQDQIKPKKSVQFKEMPKEDLNDKSAQSTGRQPKGKSFYSGVIDAGKDIDDSVFQESRDPESRESLDSNTLGKNLLNYE